MQTESLVAPSTTDPDARLSKKSQGGEARLSYMGHVLMENRNGLVVEHCVSISTGTAEPEAAVEMVSAIPGSHRITVGMDKGYDRAACVKDLRELHATPHVAQRKVSSAIDGRPVWNKGCFAQVYPTLRLPGEQVAGSRGPTLTRPSAESRLPPTHLELLRIC